MLEWRWPNFSPDEMRCKETGDLRAHPDFMDKLQKLRTVLGEPLRITSAYRSPRHSVERKKQLPGTHTLGRAVDIAADGRLQYRIISLAPGLGFTGIGIAKTFIHLDDWDGGPRPNVWIY
jgi:uncharacterized protein YcbK (DUF882 family)